MSKITKPNFTDVWSSAGSKTTPSSLKIQTGWVGEKPPYEYWNWAMNRNDVGAAYSFQMGIAEWDSTVEYQYSASYKSYVQRNGLVYKALQVGANKDPASEAAYWELAFDDYGVADTVQSNLTAHISNYNDQALRLIANGIDANLNVTNHLPNINVDTFLIPEGYFDDSTLGDKPFSFGLCKTWKEDSTVVYQFAQSSTNGDFATRLYRNSLGYWTDWKYYANISGSSTQLFSAANGTTGYEVVNKSQLDTKAPTAGNAAQEFAVATATTGNSAVNLTQLDTKAPTAGNAAQEFAVAAATTGNNAVNLTQLNTATTIQSGAIIRSVYAETTGVSLSSTPADIVTATISCAAGVATKFRVTAKIPFSVNSGNDTNATFILNNVTDGVNIDSSYHWDRDMSNAGMTGISVLQREITLTPVGTTVQFKAYGSTSVAGTAGNTYSGVAGYCTLIVEAIKI